MSDAPPDEAAPPVVAVPPPTQPPADPPVPLPAVVNALEDRLEAARAHEAAAMTAHSVAAHRLREVSRRVEAAEADLARLPEAERRAARRLLRARSRLERQAVAAYTGGALATVNVVVGARDMNELVRRVGLVQAAIDSSRRSLHGYRAARTAAGVPLARTVAELADARAAVALAAEEEVATWGAVQRAGGVVAAIEAGSTVAVRGFVFPVAGPRRFSHDWGAPRMPGTPLAHAHQGTDIFADRGTPVVAVERGVVARVGTDRLGGIKLWLVGETGNRYYLAHLSAFEPGVVDGLVVEAGQVLGYVGNTGNAITTPPHLHFEVHPAGLSAVDPYPLLRASDAAAPPAVTAAS